MKVTQILNTQPIKPPLYKCIRNAFVNGHNRLKELTQDVFETIARENKYITYGGVRMREIDLPSFAGEPDGYDYGDVQWKEAVYYPEDIKKMESMTVDECIAYKGKLLEEGHYTLRDI